MRRWLIVLVALVIAAQFSWAVEATTTGIDELHSAGAEVALATSPSSATDGSDVAQAQGNDTAHICDASHCHCFHGYAAAVSPVRCVLEAAPPSAPCGVLAGIGESHIPPRLERPNWRRA